MWKLVNVTVTVQYGDEPGDLYELADEYRRCVFRAAIDNNMYWDWETELSAYPG
jgi:hypothetical protein